MELCTIIKIVKMVCACGLGVGWVSPVKNVKKVTIVKMVWACCWGGVMYYGENIGKGENGLGVWLGCLVGTPSENCENRENGENSENSRHPIRICIFTIFTL